MRDPELMWSLREGLEVGTIDHVRQGDDDIVRLDGVEEPLFSKRSATSVLYPGLETLGSS